jgi:hypothetical protein
MKFLEEITDWGTQAVPNHIYYLNDDKTKMVGYIKSGTTELFKFKTPISISTRGRKFKLVNIAGEPDSAYFAAEKKATTSSNVIARLAGSNGSFYEISKNGANYSCTCTGFQFRKKCKHVEQFINKGN